MGRYNALRLKNLEAMRCVIGSTHAPIRITLRWYIMIACPVSRWACPPRFAVSKNQSTVWRN
tara:strand:- start:4642 stop:4827 length:186 start_codon:yes stop_codon:yes gene_type:complete